MDVLKDLWNDQDFLIKATSVFIVMAWALFACLAAKTKKKKEGNEYNSGALEAEGTVGIKYICHPRKGSREPVLVVPKKDRAAVRKSGKCELMVTVTCVGGFVFAEWVTPKFFDSVELGSKVTVAYTEDPKTQTKHCVSIKKK